MHLLLAFYGTFAIVALVGLAFGVVLGWWLRGGQNDRAAVVGSGDGWLEPILDEPVYAAGVAKVGE